MAVSTNVLMRKRITRLFIITAAVLFVLIGRLGWIQFVQGSELQQMANENRLKDITVQAKRGTIYDRNGVELAKSISADSIYVVPAEVKNKEQVARSLSKILDMDYQKVLLRISKRTSWIYLKRKVTPEQAAKVKKLNYPGIGLTIETKRSYPFDNLAAHVLGFIGIDNDASSANGLEKTYDTELRGTDGRIAVEYDATGKEIPQATHYYSAPTDGKSLVLTIDEVIQHFAERELDNIMQKYKPVGATILVMDPKTGDVLAMANRPDYNPNNYGEFDPKTWRNRAISDNYEPGSTFKIITAASALEEGAVRPSDTFNDPGFIMVSDRKIKCWDTKGHGHQTFTQVAENSCNPGFITVGLRLGGEKFYKYIRGFGFGQKTKIGLPGEASGIIIPEKIAKQINIATMSIGQSIAVTPIQLVTAVSAVANNGVLLRPHLVKEIKDNKGNVEKIEPQEVGRLISKDTAKELRSILESVVQNGSGKNAFIEGYKVAGKTGTAQKAINGRYVSGKYVSSFIGFAPADNPRLVCLVAIDEPQGYPYFGSQTAAPAFQKVMADSLRYLGVAPENNGKLPEGSTEVKAKDVKVPDVINMTLEEAHKALLAAGLKEDTEGSGNIVFGQLPLEGAKVKEGSRVILYLGNKAKFSKGQVTVPSVLGKSMREAGEILGAVGLKMDPEGSGTGASQSITPGTKVKTGTLIKVRFADPNQKQKDNDSSVSDKGTSSQGNNKGSGDSGSNQSNPQEGREEDNTVSGEGSLHP